MSFYNNYSRSLFITHYIYQSLLIVFYLIIEEISPLLFLLLLPFLFFFPPCREEPYTAHAHYCIHRNKLPVLQCWRTRASMEWAETREWVEPRECVYELCDDTFCQSTSIHEWIYVKRLAWLLVRYNTTPAPETVIEKTWAPAQSHQVTTLNHHLPKEVGFTVCIKRWHCSEKYRKP